jgi:prophage DNA circulation protein
MTLSTQVIHALPLLRWRGLTAPCTDASYRYQHNQAEKRYPYRNGFGHEDTGNSSIEISVTLEFSNSVEEFSYPENWDKWREALSERGPGDLVHPDLGSLRAVVKDVSVELSAENTAGITVSVVFAQTLEDVEADATTAVRKVSIEPVLANVTAAHAQAQILADQTISISELIAGARAVPG